MSPIDRAVLAERTLAVTRHLGRVAAKLPPSADALQPETDASDAVILHLLQATQIVIDLAARLVKAVGFRNLVAHAYEQLDMRRIPQAATAGPADLRAFLAALTRHAKT